MVGSHAFAALGRLFQRQPAPTLEELAGYADRVFPDLERAEALYQDWFEQSALFIDNEKLANGAAIHRWETARMSRMLKQVLPPSVLAQPHHDLIASLSQASRAAQLLSSGSRFHNASAVCDGQMMLEESRERRLHATNAIQRYVERRQAEETEATEANAEKPTEASAEAAAPEPAQSTPGPGS
jgi:hypothetical protein